MKESEKVPVGIGPRVEVADLPDPPTPWNWRTILKWIGPSAIALGILIGSGEWLIGPALYVKYGLGLLWITTASVFLQTITNIEYGRYTLATGEPITVGMMRLWPGPKFWAPLVSIVGVLHVAWPGWAAAGATAIAAVILGRVPGVADKPLVLAAAAVTFIVCMVWLFAGTKVELTLEKVYWLTIAIQLGLLGVLCILYVPGSRWLEGFAGFFNFGYIPKGVDWVALGALAGYAGLGGFYNTCAANYYRDKGFAMGQKVGYIPAVFLGGKKVVFSPVGKIFKPTKDNVSRWKSWFRLVDIDQWVIFFIGAMFGMLLPALLYVSYVTKPVSGWGVAALLAEGFSAAIGWWAWPLILIYSFFLLFDTQVGVVETIVRQVTDMGWWGSSKLRAFFKEDIRRLYYALIAILWIWGLIVIGTGIAAPMVLLWIGANIANLAFFIAAVGTLLVNRKFLPKEIQPSLWRQIIVIADAIFFAFFFFNTLSWTFLGVGI